MAMTEDGRKQTWWVSLPGVVKAVAALITAIGGLILALHATGVLPRGRSMETTPVPVPRTDGSSSTDVTTRLDVTASNAPQPPGQPANEPRQPAGAGGVSAPSEALVYATYTNPKYGFSVPYPKDVLKPWKAQGDFLQSFRSVDGKAEMSVTGVANLEHMNVPATFEDTVRLYSRDVSNEIVYKVERPNGFELLVKKRNSRLFRMTMIVTAAEYRTVTLEYDESARGTFDAVWTQIVREFGH